MEQKERMCISIQEMAQLLGIGMTSAYKLANDKEFYPAKRVCGRRCSLRFIAKVDKRTK